MRRDKCWFCGESKPITKHHIWHRHDRQKYRNLREHLSWLCRDCHRTVHNAHCPSGVDPIDFLNCDDGLRAFIIHCCKWHRERGGYNAQQIVEWQNELSRLEALCAEEGCSNAFLTYMMATVRLVYTKRLPHLYPRHDRPKTPPIIEVKYGKTKDG